MDTVAHAASTWLEPITTLGALACTGNAAKRGGGQIAVIRSCGRLASEG